MTRVNLHEAAKQLGQGAVIGVPTETVYGLAASLDQPNAIENIFHLKKRPLNNPLIIHLAKAADVQPFIKHDLPHLTELMAQFWPGPLTLILPVKETLIPPIPRAHLPTAGFRVPCHPLTQALLELTGPLVMPSANLSGRPSSTLPSHLEEDFGLNFPVLDGGPCAHGLESTILYYDQAQWVIIRQGALTPEDFKTCLGYPPEVRINQKSQAPLCPGQMYRHYAPKTLLHPLSPQDASYRGTVLGFAGRSYPLFCRFVNLGDLKNPHSIAENLYTHLRKLDEELLPEALVDMNFPATGLLATIKERLEKAISKA